MKTSLAIITLLTLCGCSRPDIVTRPTEVGRYQLLAASPTVVNGDSTTKMDTVLKIDSVTGRTWMFFAAPSSGFVGWKELKGDDQAK